MAGIKQKSRTKWCGICHAIALRGEDEIRTRGTLETYVGLANRWFQPLTHLSSGPVPNGFVKPFVWSGLQRYKNIFYSKKQDHCSTCANNAQVQNALAISSRSAPKTALTIPARSSREPSRWMVYWVWVNFSPGANAAPGEDVSIS